MRAHYLQHVPFEGLGSIEAWLQRSGYDISCTRLFESDELPAVEAVDLLVIMGGPMSVNDETTHPWLVKEKVFIRKLIEAGKPVLGICLGAQLIASAMGAKVYPGAQKEIGWYPIQAVETAEQSVFTFPAQVEVFHWHGETFDLPDTAVQLAQSEACQNQAFQLDRHVIGMQFHLETTPSAAQSIVDNCRDELVDGRYIQSEAEILAAPPERYDTANRLMGEVLTYLHKQAGR